MTETIERMNETEVTELKPAYTFRKLAAEDMFLMFSIIKKIGLKEFKQCFEGDTLNTLVNQFKAEGGDDKALTAVGMSLGIDLIDLVLGNLPKCEREIYQLLAQTSDLTEDEIKSDMILFTEMVVDFVKKEEFPAFIKVVSRLFK